jgi:hypothetical protein
VIVAPGGYAHSMSSTGKFWGTLSIWKVLLVFLIANLVLQLIGVALREGLGIGLVTPTGAAGAGGIVSVLIVSAMANKQRSSGASSS